ncbi:hypothetical protein PRIPAC_78380, partial [Pristionchus pacificus]|uniref:Uncharacterized protein n=1 Tax=Pristionchus pacificus TaxID=54126 RepID=A0A2A6CM73_PRIPA
MPRLTGNLIYIIPAIFQAYSRILFISALGDLIGAFMLPSIIPRSILFNEANVLDYYGFCTIHSVESCWICTVFDVSSVILQSGTYFPQENNQWSQRQLGVPKREFARRSKLMLIRALNVQLLILSCFFTGAVLLS